MCEYACVRGWLRVYVCAVRTRPIALVCGVSVCLYVRVWLRAWARVRNRVCKCVCVFAGACVGVAAHVRWCVWVKVFAHMCIYVPVWLCARVRASMCVCVCVCVRVCVYGWTMGQQDLRFPPS